MKIFNLFLALFLSTQGNPLASSLTQILQGTPIAQSGRHEEFPGENGECRPGCHVDDFHHRIPICVCN